MVDVNQIYQMVLHKILFKIYKKEVGIKYLNHLTMGNSSYKSIIKAIDKDLINVQGDLNDLRDSLIKYPSQLNFWDRINILL